MNCQSRKVDNIGLPPVVCGGGPTMSGMEIIVNIQDDIIRLHGIGVLDLLLADKTTGNNILWTTEAYAERGGHYEATAEITSDFITGEENIGIIRTRARKAFEQQSARKRQRAEVFTPLWLCKKMCDYLDEVWFRRKIGFYKVRPDNGHIMFSSNRTWKQYVHSRRMEIACGEGPFLVSRYDATTGSVVPVENRIGILDRKMRIISENANSEEEWLLWAEKAFQSVYGYELQGDNLLIARVNLIMTFVEYLYHRWGRMPTVEEYHCFSNIIAWNLWQMNGLTGETSVSGIDNGQISLFDDDKKDPVFCKIYNWRQQRRIEYREINKGNCRMKFDYIIGNPPYQEENDSNNRKKPVYDRFMDESYKLADVIELITPARFLFNVGYTPKDWNQKMLNDEHFHVLYYEPDRDKIFPNTDIKGGVVVSIYNHKRIYEKIIVFTPFAELNSIIHKILQINGTSNSFSDIISARGLYRFSSLFFRENPYATSVLGKGTGNMIASNAFEKLPEVFLESVPLDDKQYIRMLGLVKKERVHRFIRKDYVISNDYTSSYNVLFPKANGNGEFGEILAPPEISEVGDGATDTFLNIGQFYSLYEAESAIKYIKTKFSRALLGVKKVTQDCPRAVWQMIPLQDFTPQSDIDWSRTIPQIDTLLYRKYSFDRSEIDFIESHVKEMT